jgi:hypothetical protein
MVKVSMKGQGMKLTIPISRNWDAFEIASSKPKICRCPRYSNTLFATQTSTTASHPGAGSPGGALAEAAASMRVDFDGGVSPVWDVAARPAGRLSKRSKI